MTDVQKVLLRQVIDTITEKYGSISQFCKKHHMSYSSIYNFLHGRKNYAWDEDLYEFLSERAKTPPAINPDLVLFDHVCSKYFENVKELCRTSGITMKQLQEARAHPEKSIFRRVAFKVYNQALYDICGIDRYAIKQRPGKFLDFSVRRTKGIQKHYSKLGKRIGYL